MVRILLADDHAVVRRGLRALFQARQEFSVCAEASNGRDAVELVLHHKPDVAILDISLPVLNGIEATRKIRKDAPETGVLIFTSSNRENEIRAVLHAGARGWVLKSDADAHILGAVEALARHSVFFSDNVSEILLADFFGQTGLGNSRHLLTSRERKVVQLIARGVIAARRPHPCSASASRPLRPIVPPRCASSTSTRPPNSFATLFEKGWCTHEPLHGESSFQGESIFNLSSV
jgi:DNA-binding NarL/FixJ family response regulator